MKLIGKGRTATVYGLDGNRVLKVFNRDFPETYVDQEYALTRLLSHEDLPMPKALGRQTYEDRSGIIYERAEGNPLLALLTSGETDTQTGGRILAEVHFKIHRVTCPQLPDYSAAVSGLIPRLPLTEAGRAELACRLAALPAGSAVCHLDYHPDNVLVGNKITAIDWITAHSGNAAADVCNTLIILTYAPLPELPQAQKAVVEALRLSIRDAYLQSYMTASARTEDDIRRWWLPALVFRYFHGTPEERPVLLEAIRAGLDGEETIAKR